MMSLISGFLQEFELHLRKGCRVMLASIDLVLRASVLCFNMAIFYTLVRFLHVLSSACVSVVDCMILYVPVRLQSHSVSSSWSIVFLIYSWMLSWWLRSYSQCCCCIFKNGTKYEKFKFLRRRLMDLVVCGFCVCSFILKWLRTVPMFLQLMVASLFVCGITEMVVSLTGLRQEREQGRSHSFTSLLLTIVMSSCW